MSEKTLELARLEAGLRAKNGIPILSAEEAGFIADELDRLRASLAHAEARSEYWKAEHLAGNAEVDRWKVKARKLGEWAAECLRIVRAAERVLSEAGMPGKG